MTTEEISNKTKVQNFFNVISKKIFRLEPEEVSCSTGAERVVASMKTTAVSRYHASTRLAWQSKIAFLTTTILSLGLIFIPLMQLAQIPLRLNANVLSAVQIFMAVAILVYSVIIGTAKYETRCENLNDCGDKIKDLIRELRREMDADKNVEKTKLEDIQKRYAFIVADVENHQRCDYSLTILRNRDLYEISLFCLIKYKLLYYFIILLNYIPTILLLTIEFIIISDMFGITTIFSFLGTEG